MYIYIYIYQLIIPIVSSQSHVAGPPSDEAVNGTAVRALGEAMVMKPTV